MGEPRFNKVYSIFGKRGTGKTEFTKGNPRHNLPGLVNLYLNLGFKVLVCDTVDHPSWRHLPILDFDSYEKFTKGFARIICKSSEFPKLFEFLNDHPNTWNSLLIFEDARKHTYINVNKHLIELIGDSKQKNIDIVFMYHLWAQCPLDLLRYLDYIEVFKTKDSPTSREEALVRLCIFEECMRVYNLVDKNKNPYFHATIDTDND